MLGTGRTAWTLANRFWSVDRCFRSDIVKSSNRKFIEKCLGFWNKFGQNTSSKRTRLQTLILIWNNIFGIFAIFLNVLHIVTGLVKTISEFTTNNLKGRNSKNRPNQMKPNRDLLLNDKNHALLRNSFYFFSILNENSR